MKFKTGECLVVDCVGESDRLYRHNKEIIRAEGILVKSDTRPTSNSNGAYWFTATLLEDYPTIPHPNYKGQTKGLVRGDQIKFQSAYVRKISRAKRRSR